MALFLSLVACDDLESSNSNVPDDDAGHRHEDEQDLPLRAISHVDSIDPVSCQACHAEHYDQWSGSMHAYASIDPLFHAMNAEFQDQYGDIAPDFCIKCHAPMALRDGLTTNGLNAAELPSAYQGITCVFCHATEEVSGVSDNPLQLGDLRTLRGGISQPIPNDFHRSRFSPYFDRDDDASSSMCGSCHDITGVHDILLEKTFDEWKESIYNTERFGAGLSCASCHLRGRSGPASSITQDTLRRVHDHSMVGLDTALTHFPNQAEQTTLIQQALQNTLAAELCVNPAPGGSQVVVTLDNIGAGHGFPSGATFDRRAWVELKAYQDDELILSRGVVEDGQPAKSGDVEHLLTLWDTPFRHDSYTHRFWDADQVDRQSIQAPKTLDPDDPDFQNHIKRAELFIPGAPPERISMVVKVRPFGLDIVDTLVDTDYLDPEELVFGIPTFELGGTNITWDAATDGNCVPRR